MKAAEPGGPEISFENGKPMLTTATTSDAQRRRTG